MGSFTPSAEIYLTEADRRMTEGSVLKLHIVSMLSLRIFYIAMNPCGLQPAKYSRFKRKIGVNYLCERTIHNL